MARKKYIRDYRLVERTDERGRIRTDYEYIGSEYFYISGRERAGRGRRLALILLAAGWAAFVAALLPDAGGMRAVYVALPFLFSAVPLGFLTDTLLTAATAPEPLRHQQADKLTHRFPAAALWTAILPGAALIGEGIWLLSGGAGVPGDILFSACAALLTAAGIWIYSLRERFACRERDRR